MKMKQNEISEEEICTLKIRTDAGKVCILHLEREAEVRHIYEWMNKVVGEKKKYSLMGNYPRRVYDREEKESIEELGLFPNAMLHVHIGESKV